MSTISIEQIDPTTLLADINVRTDLALDKAFLASVRDNGVIVPVTARRTDDGIRLRTGQRRLAAALAADLAAIPVVIIDRGDDEDEVVRIVEQLAENDHRAGMTNADRIAANNQLALLGVSAAQIAKRTHRPRKEVDAALAIGDDAKGIKVAKEYTLQVAAWTMEFPDDADAVRAILDAAGRGGEGSARHTVERLRQDRARHTAVAEVTAQVQENNPESQVLDAHPGYSDRTAAPTGHLTGVGPKSHKRCPHRAFLVVATYSESGKNITTASNGVPVEVQEWCTDWKAAGHDHRYHQTKPAKAAAGGDAGADAAAEAARVERRRVIAGNREWDAAKVVRTEWTEALLSRRTLPKDAVTVIANAAHVTSLQFAYTERHTEYATPAEATRAMLALALHTLESETDRKDWRNTRLGTQVLLTALIGWGYTASAVEEAAAGIAAYAAPDKSNAAKAVEADVDDANGDDHADSDVDEGNDDSDNEGDGEVLAA